MFEGVPLRQALRVSAVLLVGLLLVAGFGFGRWGIVVGGAIGCALALGLAWRRERREGGDHPRRRP